MRPRPATARGRRGDREGGRPCRGRPGLSLDRLDPGCVQTLLAAQLADQSPPLGRRRFERRRASLRGCRQTVQLGIPFGQPRRELRQPRARPARLLHDPVVLAGGPADPIEAGNGLVERLGAEQHGERIAAGLLIERAGQVRELALRCQQRLSRDRQLRLCGSPLACQRLAARFDPCELGARPAELRLERVQLERRRRGACLQRAGAGLQARGSRLRAGRARRECDGNGREQEQSCENGCETRRIARRMRFHEARTVAPLPLWRGCLCFVKSGQWRANLAQLSVAAIRQGC